MVGRTNPLWRHGPAGLLMALFLVAAIIFSYGLGHTPPLRVCTAHAMSVPVEIADAMAAHPKPADLELVRGSSSFSDPFELPPFGPADTCLYLAILLGLMALSLAAKPRRTGGRRPPRSGWALSAPALPAPFALSLSSLQVLRL